MARAKNVTGRQRLVEKILELKKGAVRGIVDSRIKEFGDYKKKSGEGLFSELCFCITTANCAAESCIRIQQEIGGGYSTFSEEKLSSKLKGLGYRFPNKRASYIVAARKHRDAFVEKIKKGAGGKEMREWLVENVKGLGYKEASHFLRNIGYSDEAIIDFHIVDILVRHGIIEKPGTLTKKKYLEIEKALSGLAAETCLTLAELDLYLWYMETGKVLK